MAMTKPTITRTWIRFECDQQVRYIEYDDGTYTREQWRKHGFRDCIPVAKPPMELDVLEAVVNAEDDAGSPREDDTP